MSSASVSAKSNGTSRAKFRTYRSALNYLKATTNYENLPPAGYDKRNFNLVRMTKILEHLGCPESKMKTVHIAGTKGKGSTATMVACMLRNCGYKVGLYTSPHLLSVCERMTIDGVPPSEKEFAKVLSTVAIAAERANGCETLKEEIANAAAASPTRRRNIRDANPTFFELITAAAFQWFADNEVDVAIIEAGLGGRLDSTNVIKPEVCAITSISYDHMPQLGTTLASIAEEKAGIIKEGIPVVSAPQRPEVVQVLRSAAANKEAPLYFPGENSEFSYRFESNRTVGPHTRLSLTTEQSRFEHLQVPLPGEHQAINCSVALSMIDQLKTRGFEIDDQKAIEGLSSVQLRGRMEIIRDEPRILVDGAHNAASVEALMRAIGQTVPYDSMVVIFACQKDKDVAGMLRHVQLGADKIIFTSSGTARSADPEELLHMFQEISGKMAQVAYNLEEAVEIARSACTREDLICITGSFYVVGAATRLFGNGAE